MLFMLIHVGLSEFDYFFFHYMHFSLLYISMSFLDTMRSLVELV